MTLTEEQRERIRKNRERALDIKRKRKAEEEERRLKNTAEDAAASPDGKKQKAAGDAARAGLELEDEEDVVLEDFEVQASAYVTKKEAMKVYCLPEGTLAVCKFVEKENPHRKGWTPMKLYSRAEIRRRARKRFGDLEGLVNERNRRERKRFEKDLEKTESIFE